MTSRLDHIVDQVASVGVRRVLPYVALEHLDGGVGRLLPGVELAEVDGGEPTGMVQFQVGDVLFGKLRPYLAKSWLADREGLCSTELIVMRPRSGAADSRWLRYLVESAPFIDWAVATSDGVKMPRTSWEKLRLYEVAPIPLRKQRIIADYLDAETARIDRLVEALQAANRALSVWLATSVETVVWSNVEATAPLMRLTLDERQIQYGIVLPGPDVEDGVPIVKGGDLLSGVLTADGLARTTREIEAGYARSRLRAHDIAFAIRGAVGACALVPAEVDGANITQDVALIAPRRDVDPTWLLYALRSPSVQAQAEARILGATIRGINIRDLKRLRVPVLPLREQRDRAAELRRLQGRHDLLTSARTRQFDLLLERRQALITAAVTGRLETAGVAA